MITLKRLFHSSRSSLLKLDPNFKFKCGLEIHTQLKTEYKLFSLSQTSFNSTPNTKISYYDCALPGTQPKFNPEALYLSLKAAVALNCKIQSISSFDRKHYFYPDQPAGYQITQYYHPIAVNGYLELLKEYDDILETSKRIGIERIQIEQDTGKTNYDRFDNVIKVDLNRTNIPLIEVVTEPDFENFEQIRSFIKKYQAIVKYLDICSGDLETGAIRVDVNVSVNGNSRVELKNLGSTGEIHDAVEAEYSRQINLLRNKETIIQETRGWNGYQSISLRTKEDSVDYRYLPDSELPKICLEPDINEQVQKILPELPQDILKKLTHSPYELELKYAKFLVDNRELLDYYLVVCKLVASENSQGFKLVNNWVINELLGAFHRLETSIDLKLITPLNLSQLILMVSRDDVTKSAAKRLITQMIKNPDSSGASIEHLLGVYDLGKPKDVSPEELDSAIEELCGDIINKNMDVVNKIKKGKKNSLNYLVGQAMRETQGKVESKAFAKKFMEMISCK